MVIKKPNLFVVGAMKAGTTSLYYLLKQHPQIYMSPVKEPHFFSKDILLSSYDPTPHESLKSDIKKVNYEWYLSLFKDVKDHKIIGECSNSYLYYYKICSKKIKEFNPEAKILIILRNPIDRAFSNYVYFKLLKRESLKSFEDAIKAEMHRKNENWWWSFLYVDIGFYYKQVKAYLDLFGYSRVKVILFDDLKSNYEKTIENIFDFLEVEKDVSLKLYTYNPSGIPKNKFIYTYFESLFINKNFLKTLIKKLMPISMEEKVRGLYWKFAYNAMKKLLQKPMLSPDTKSYLINIYKEDILKLQELIQRDLSFWLK